MLGIILKHCGWHDPGHVGRIAGARRTLSFSTMESAMCAAMRRSVGRTAL